MTDHTEPITQRLENLSAEFNGHINWLIDQLSQAQLESHMYQVRDERIAHWRASGRAQAYREVLTDVFGLDWAQISRRQGDRAKAAS